MRRFVVLVAIAATIGGFAFADDLDTKNWDSYFKNGDTSASLGVGVGLGSTFSLVAYPGFEMDVFDTKVGDVFPMAVGVAAKGMIGLHMGNYNALVIGAGAFVPFHFSLKGLNVDILNRLDFYVAPGVALSFALGDVGWHSSVQLGFGDYAGINYFVSDEMAVYVEQVYWGYYWGGSVGVTLKL